MPCLGFTALQGRTSGRKNARAGDGRVGRVGGPWAGEGRGAEEGEERRGQRRALGLQEAVSWTEAPLRRGGRVRWSVVLPTSPEPRLRKKTPRTMGIEPPALCRNLGSFPSVWLS